jgi:hypothetical protein
MRQAPGTCTVRAMTSHVDDATVAGRSIFREVNDRLSSFNAELSYLLPSAAVVCECANAYCAEVIEVPFDIYEAVRRTPRRFVVAAGVEHVTASRDRVVLKDAEYWIVEALEPS